MFEAIGEGHKIMHEGPKKEIDLDELERLRKAAEATPGPWEPRQGEPVFVRDYDEDEWLVRIFIKKHGGQYLASVFEHMNSYMSWRQCKPFFPGLIAENRELRARVQELEAQRDWLAKLLGDLCTAQKDGQCPLFYNCPAAQFGWSCGSTLKQDWIYAAEKDAGEAEMDKENA